MLVTRPQAQADALCLAIEQSGGQALRYPMLELSALPNDPSIAAAIDQLDQYDLVIFISANAVRFGLEALPPLPPSTAIAAVGVATQKALADRGYTKVTVPREDFSSEGLLALPELQEVQGQRILIVRGQGGREYLKQQLQQRGAEVDYLACYQRQPAAVNQHQLRQTIRMGQVDVIYCSSVQALDQLIALVPDPELFDTALLPISPRMLAHARRAGFKQLLPCAANAGDAAILTALRQHPPSLETTMSEKQELSQTTSSDAQPKTTAASPSPSPKKPAQAAKPKDKKSGGGLGTLLALLALGAVGGASAYGWMELEKLKQQLAQQDQVKQDAADNADTLFRANMAKRFDTFNTQQQLLKRQLGELENSVANLATEQSKDQRGWIIAEAEYLMRMANARLRLLRDVRAATEALKSADQRIADLADPSFFDVRQALALEISALQSLNPTDANGAAMKLLALNKLLSSLPPAKLIHGEPREMNETSVGEEGSLLADLTQFIGLKKSNRPYMALPQQEDIFYLDQLMRLEIEAARHAVLRFDAVTYQHHIDNARDLLSAHYAQDHEQVKKVGEELKALSANRIFPKLPDITSSSLALNKAKNRYVVDVLVVEPTVIVTPAEPEAPAAPVEEQQL